MRTTIANYQFHDTRNHGYFKTLFVFILASLITQVTEGFGFLPLDLPRQPVINDGEAEAKETSVSTSTYIKTFGGSGNDNVESATVLNDGSLATIGFTESFGAGDKDIVFAKWDGLGIPIWTNVLGSVDMEWGVGIDLADQGFVASANGIVARFNAQGHLEWTKRISEIDWLNSIREASDGSFVATGVVYLSNLGAGNRDVVVTRLSESGDVLWTKTLGNGSNDYGRVVTITDDDGIVVTGSTRSDSQNDILLARLEMDGQITWMKKIGGSQNDRAFDIISMSNGDLMVAGDTESAGAGMKDAFVARLNSTGSLHWIKTYGDASQNFARSIIETTDGNLAMTGETGEGDNIGITVTKVLSEDGTVLWSHYLTLGSGVQRSYSIQEDSNSGDLLVAGETRGSEEGATYDAMIIRLTKDGWLYDCTASVTPFSLTQGSPEWTLDATNLVVNSYNLTAIDAALAYVGIVDAGISTFCAGVQQLSCSPSATSSLSSPASASAPASSSASASASAPASSSAPASASAPASVSSRLSASTGVGLFSKTLSPSPPSRGTTTNQNDGDKNSSSCDRTCVAEWIGIFSGVVAIAAAGGAAAVKYSSNCKESGNQSRRQPTVTL